MMNRKLDSPEVGTILAALRLYQKMLKENPEKLPENVAMISTDDGYFR